MATKEVHVGVDELAVMRATYEHHASKLEEIRQLLENSTLEIAVGGSPNDRRIDDWPIPGRSRFAISDRRSAGNDNLAVPAQTTTPATLVFAALPGRIGGSIVNAGANPAFLYLADPQRVVYQAGGLFALWLAASGGSWDFRIGNALWAGVVSTISPLGTTLVVGQV